MAFTTTPRKTFKKSSGRQGGRKYSGRPKTYSSKKKVAGTLGAMAAGAAIALLKNKIINPDKIGLNEYTLGKLNDLQQVGQKFNSITRNGINMGVREVGRDVGRTYDLGKVAFAEENSIKIETRGSRQIKSYTTKLALGRPSAVALKRAAKMNGTTRRTFFDSNIVSTTDVETDALFFNFGFNQKHLRTYLDLGHISANDYLEIFDIAAITAYSADKDERAYGGVLKEWYEYKFINSSAYLPVKLSVDIYRPSTDVLTIPEVFDLAVNTVSTAQNQGRMPVRRQLTNPVLTGGIRSVQLDPEANLNYAERWRSRMSKIRTVSKVLQPGEVWDLKWDVYLGSGPDLERLNGIYLDDVNNIPAFMYFISAVGMDCEMRTILGGRSNIGTSPGNVTMETKKGVEFVNDTAVRTINTNPAQGGYTDVKPLIRVFTNKPENQDKIFNANNDQIGAPTSTGTILYYVPLTVDAVETFADRKDGLPT